MKITIKHKGKVLIIDEQCSESSFKWNSELISKLIEKAVEDLNKLNADLITGIEEPKPNNTK